MAVAANKFTLTLVSKGQPELRFTKMVKHAGGFREGDAMDVVLGGTCYPTFRRYDLMTDIVEYVMSLDTDAIGKSTKQLIPFLLAEGWVPLS